jgi:hypothetical protein
VPEELVVVLDLPADEGPETVVVAAHSTHLSQPARHARETRAGRVWRPCTVKGDSRLH